MDRSILYSDWNIRNLDVASEHILLYFKETKKHVNNLPSQQEEEFGFSVLASTLDSPARAFGFSPPSCLETLGAWASAFRLPTRDSWLHHILDATWSTFLGSSVPL